MKEIVLINLKKIYQAPGQKLDASQFEVHQDEVAMDKAAFIKLLEDEHLIETEDDPNLYFLTPLGYEFVEQSDDFEFKEEKEERIQQRRAEIDAGAHAKGANSIKRVIIIGAILLVVFYLILRFFTTIFSEPETTSIPESALSEETIHQLKTMADSVRDAHNFQENP